MRVVVFGLSSQRGGVESCILGYVEKLLDLDSSIEIDFIVFDEIPVFAHYLERAGCRFFTVPSRTKHPIVNAVRLKEICKTGKYDILWYNCCTLSDITLIKAAKGIIPRIMIHAHSSQNIGNLVNGILHIVHKRKACSLGTDFLSCSDDASLFMYTQEIVKSKKHQLIWNSVDTNSFRFNQTERERIRHENGLCGPVFIHVGRFHAEKNHAFLIDVFKEINLSIPESRLLLLGDGELESKIREKVDLENLSLKVLFVGSVSNVGDYLSAADLFILPSIFEGLPFCLVEAQINGLPCIVSSGVSNQAPMANESIKLQLDAGPVKWAEEAINLLNRSKCREDIDSELNRFDLEKNAEKFLSLLKKED
ncbi:MAG: glycosyltransferase [Anaerotardibacter sp.]